MLCANCLKELHEDDDVFVCLNNWLQWERYSKFDSEAGCYCSLECFAEYWDVECMTVDEYREEVG